MSPANKVVANIDPGSSSCYNNRFPARNCEKQQQCYCVEVTNVNCTSSLS